VTRKENWQTALYDHLQRVWERPFAYGEHDCCLFAAGCIEAQTGVDVADGLRGQYSDRRSALRMMRRLCGQPSLERVVETQFEHLGLLEVSVSMAQRGDVVLLELDGVLALGILAPHGTAIIAPSEKGLVYLPMNRARRAWAVGVRAATSLVSEAPCRQ